MSDIERDLREMLNERAGATATGPGDWQDLTVRMARRNRRAKRVMAGALVLALLVGPIAGFAVARAVQGDGADGRVTAAGPSSAVGGAAAVSTDAANQLAALGVYAGGNLEKLFRRTTSDGIAVRAYVSPIKTTSCQGDGWCPPAGCFPDARIVGELSNDAAVGMASAARYGGTAPTLKVQNGGYFGVNGEGSPARWVIAQTGGGVAKVRVSFDGGGSDEMAPVDGVVVLAATGDPAKTGGTVEALDASGAVVDHADAVATSGMTLIPNGNLSVLPPDTGDSSASTGSSSAAATTTTLPPTLSTPPATIEGGQIVTIAPEVPTPGASTPRPECQPPPPSLPASGEQPADPAAAKAEIEQAFSTAYAGGLSDDSAKSAVVQDSDSLKAAMDRIRTGSFAQQVKDASAKVTEVVFTSPTEAAVRYDIDVANYTDFKDRIGKALFLDGHWKVAKVTVCADIGLAGGSCTP